MGIDRMADPPPQEGTEATRASAAALYTFLKEFTQLRTKTVRSLDQYDHTYSGSPMFPASLGVTAPPGTAARTAKAVKSGWRSVSLA